MDDFRFKVAREPLPRKDGTDTMYDALYREDTGEQLHVVSRDYQLLTHGEAVDFVHETLDGVDIAYEPFRHEMTMNGKRFMYEIRLPAYRFRVPGDDSDIDPTIKVWNSYNKTKSFVIDFGTYRLICSNGASVGVKILRVSYYHYQDTIQLRPIGEELVEQIEGVIVGVSKEYERLMKEAADKYMAAAMKVLPPMVIAYVAEETQEYFNWEYETRGSHQIPVAWEVRKKMQAYAFLQVLTAVATHRLASAKKRQLVDRDLTSIFRVKA